jgi:hypothetical protein
MHDGKPPVWENNEAWQQLVREAGGVNLAEDMASALRDVPSDARLSYFASDLPSAYRARWLAAHEPNSLELEFAKITDAIRQEIIAAQDPDHKVTVTVRLSSGEQDFVEQMLVQDGYRVAWRAAPAALDVVTSKHCTDHVIIVWAPAPDVPDENSK